MPACCAISVYISPSNEWDLFTSKTRGADKKQQQHEEGRRGGSGRGRRCIHPRSTQFLTASQFMRSYRMIKELNKLSSFGFCKEMNHFKRTLVFLTLRVALFVMSPRWNWGYVDQSCCLLRTFSMKRVGVKRGDRAFSSHGRRCLLSYGMVSRKFIRLLISPSPPLHLQHGKEEVVMRPSQARKERT